MTTQQAFFFGALISAVVCAAIANHKNRSTVVWALLGFLFGVIPVIICACCQAAEPATEHDHPRRCSFNNTFGCRWWSMTPRARCKRKLARW